MKELCFVICAAVIAVPCFAQSGGSLTPPGAPATTMKSLDEVEARIPISTPGFFISTPGSYYLTQNLETSASIDGIRINANNVTLDLNGYNIRSAFSQAGIRVRSGGTSSSNELYGITIKNGSIEGFSNGISFQNMNNSTISDVRVSSGTGGPGTPGIFIKTSGGGQCSGNTVRNCSVFNYPSGIAVSGNCKGNTLVDCSVAGAAGYGILLQSISPGANEGNRVLNCLVTSAGGTGIEVQGASGTGAGNVVEGCTVRDATGRGIYVRSATSCRIEGNHVSLVNVDGGGVSVGLQVTGSKNLVIRNSCQGATDNINISATNVYGPEVNVTGALSSTGDASHPLANFNLQ